MQRSRKDGLLRLTKVGDGDDGFEFRSVELMFSEYVFEVMAFFIKFAVESMNLLGCEIDER
jgi:hypothetical protein